MFFSQSSEIAPFYIRKDSCFNQALNEAALRQKNHKSLRSVNWVITLRRRYDDPTSPAHAGRAPGSKIIALDLVERSLVRCDSRGFGVAESFAKCAVASIVWSRLGRVPHNGLLGAGSAR